MFLSDLVLLPIAAFVPSRSKLVQFASDWAELDVSKEENVAKVVIKECIISFIFAGNPYIEIFMLQQFLTMFHCFFSSLGLCGYAIFLLYSFRAYLENVLPYSETQS